MRSLLKPKRDRDSTRRQPKAISVPIDKALSDERKPLNLQTKLRQYRAARVAQFALKQRLERIEWEDDVLKPELEQLALDAGESLSIPEYIITDDNQEDN
jgi:hypothetical protein